MRLCFDYVISVIILVHFLSRAAAIAMAPRTRSTEAIAKSQSKVKIYHAKPNVTKNAPKLTVPKVPIPYFDLAECMKASTIVQHPVRTRKTGKTRSTLITWNAVNSITATTIMSRTPNDSKLR